MGEICLCGEGFVHIRLLFGRCFHSPNRVPIATYKHGRPKNLVLLLVLFIPRDAYDTS